MGARRAFSQASGGTAAISASVERGHLGSVEDLRDRELEAREVVAELRPLGARPLRHEVGEVVAEPVERVAPDGCAAT